MKGALSLIAALLLFGCDSSGSNKEDEPEELTTEELLTLAPWHRDHDGDILFNPDLEDSWARIEFTADSLYFYNASSILEGVGGWLLLGSVVCGPFAEALAARSEIGLPGVDPFGKCPDILFVTGSGPNLGFDMIIFDLTRTRLRFGGFLINTPVLGLTYER